MLTTIFEIILFVIFYVSTTVFNGGTDSVCNLTDWNDFSKEAY